MIYLYVNSLGYYFITHTILSNKKYTLIRVFDYTIENKEVQLKKLNTSILNTPFFSSRYSYIVVLDTLTKNIKLFEPYDILKNYYINKNNDLVFEVYLINNVFKVFNHPFSFDKFYIVCPQCKDLTFKTIFRCEKCSSDLCEECNIFCGEFCQNCV